MKKINNSHSYWHKPTDGKNDAELYAGASSIPRSLYFIEMVNKYCNDIVSAMEIGCNVGRHLDSLYNNFNINITGIDISRYALDLGQKTFPSLSNGIFHCGAAEDIIKNIDTNEYDLVYSIAALMHINLDEQDDFWENIIRVSKKYIITIEGEVGGTNDRIWRRNYNQIFTKYNVVEIMSEQISRKDINNNYITRIFKKTI